MDELTQQNAALVEEAAAASESMGEQAEDLNQIQRLSLIKALRLTELLDTRFPADLIDLAGHEQ